MLKASRFQSDSEINNVMTPTSNIDEYDEFMKILHENDGDDAIYDHRSNMNATKDQTEDDAELQE